MTAEHGSVALTWDQRNDISIPADTIRNLPGTWRDVATETRGKDGSEDYARGLAAGLDIAAKQLQRHLDELAAATPSCEHDKPVTARCWKCVG